MVITPGDELETQDLQVEADVTAAPATLAAPIDDKNPSERPPENPQRPSPGGGNQLKRLDRISQRAHEIYQRRGGEHGRALEDWLQAEREIDSETEPLDPDIERRD